MARAAIVTYSSADLAPGIVARDRITVAPATITLGGNAIRSRAVFHDEHPRPEGRGSSGDEPRPQLVEAYTAVCADLAHSNDGVVAVNLSSRLGGTVAAARHARGLLTGCAPVRDC